MTGQTHTFKGFSELVKLAIEKSAKAQGSTYEVMLFRVISGYRSITTDCYEYNLPVCDFFRNLVVDKYHYLSCKRPAFIACILTLNSSSDKYYNKDYDHFYKPTMAFSCSRTNENYVTESKSWICDDKHLTVLINNRVFAVTEHQANILGLKEYIYTGDDKYPSKV